MKSIAQAVRSKTTAAGSPGRAARTATPAPDARERSAGGRSATRKAKPAPAEASARPAKKAKPAAKKPAKPEAALARVPEATPASAKPAASRAKVRVAKSGVHGRGVFAARDFGFDERIIEYKGEVITWKEALRRHPHDPKDPNHTFYFHVDDKNVIDGKYHGNAARWINHACEPNCDTDEVDGRIFIKALRPIAAGEELFYDYRLTIDERYTPSLKKQFACHCGAPGCRGTMLSPKR